ncbi:MAG: hypothetical protein IJ538_00675 [Clostridia bacterium]|nr:hypothetical protein [Clostridia bacterium]
MILPNDELNKIGQIIAQSEQIVKQNYLQFNSLYNALHKQSSDLFNQIMKLVSTKTPDKQFILYQSVGQRLGNLEDATNSMTIALQILNSKYPENAKTEDIERETSVAFQLAYKSMAAYLKEFLYNNETKQKEIHDYLNNQPTKVSAILKKLPKLIKQFVLIEHNENLSFLVEKLEAEASKILNSETPEKQPGNE